MQSNEIRKKYLDFFKSKGHTIKPSSPLTPPSDDATLLFTTAGMVQFKPLWAGGPLPFSRASTVQKCLRAGGKGSDLENVGRTLRHHTFFEMLGNFSFGDYFKREAITWAWEFVHDVIKMPKEKIWVSVYKNDDEAFNIWTKEVGILEERMVRLAEKDNFWGPAGLTGACGPCSEIYYDLGPERGCGHADCKPGCDCERYLEFWNLVFPQFYQNEDGTRKPLERRGIDTGMGLERLSFLLQKDAKNNYETDLFKPIVDEVKKFAKKPYEGENKASFHVVADHIRALLFALSENIMPSNEGRGYVLRRLLRRAVRHGRKLGITEAFLYKLTDAVVNVMRETYPEIAEAKTHATRIILSEEERFQHTIDYGLRLFEDIAGQLAKKNEKVISGDDMFKLYDTYGFPLDLLGEVAEEKGLSLDYPGFEKYMGEQKERARQSWTGAEKTAISPVYLSIHKEFGDQKFVGYEKMVSSGKVLAIVVEGVKKEKLNAGESGEIYLSETPFYAEQGGQVGDTGILTGKGEDNALAEVTDTQKIMPGVTCHRLIVKNGAFVPGEEVEAVVDKERRLSIMRHHTATHILQYALRQILGDHVKQSGSFVGVNKLRFDFTHFAAIESDELSRIQEYVNNKIICDDDAVCYELSLQDALKKGVLAFFGEKYGEKVRVLDIGGYSRELCGGTHVDRAGKIGLFYITSESSVAAGVRRVEAVCGVESLKIVSDAKNKISDICNMLKTDPENLVLKIGQISEENRNLQKEKDEAVRSILVSKADGLISSAKNLKGVSVVSANIGSVSAQNIRMLGDVLKDKIKSGIIVLGAVQDNKASLIAVVTDDLVSKGYNAGKIVKEISAIVEGTGGGKPNMAQAGGKKPENLDKALQKAIEILA